MHDDGVGVVEDTGNVKFSRAPRRTQDPRAREPQPGMRQAADRTAARSGGPPRSDHGGPTGEGASSTHNYMH